MVLTSVCSGQYEDTYIGPEQEFLVLHLDPHTDHLFRVCARGEGRTEWSPWSVPQTGYTTLAPHGKHTHLEQMYGEAFSSRLCMLTQRGLRTSKYVSDGIFASLMVFLHH